MAGWRLRFSDSLLTLNARVLPKEKIFQKSCEVGDNILLLVLLLDIPITLYIAHREYYYMYVKSGLTVYWVAPSCQASVYQFAIWTLEK